jgi:hypothetical protein
MPGKVNKTSPAFIQTAADAKRAMKDVETRLNETITETEDATEEALKEIGQRIFDRSQHLVPVDTGALKASGYVETETTPDGFEVRIGYAMGDDPPYANFVHEDLTKHHDAPTQAKFLEQAGNEVARVVPAIVAKHIKKVIQ